jgi:hypothetical protein
VTELFKPRLCVCFREKSASVSSEEKSLCAGCMSALIYIEVSKDSVKISDQLDRSCEK